MPCGKKRKKKKMNTHKRKKRLRANRHKKKGKQFIKSLFKKIIWLNIFLLTTQLLYSWGNKAHKMINEEAISLLSSPLKDYFFENRYFISKNSIKPDFWKKDTINFPGEAHGHFIDLDF